MEDSVSGFERAHDRTAPCGMSWGAGPLRAGAAAAQTARMNLAELPLAAVRALPERSALIFAARELSYGELGRAIEKAAAALAERGVSPGDRVALLDDTSPLQIAALLGAARIGAAAVPMHVQLAEREIAELVAKCGCSPIGVAGAAHAERLA